MLYNTNNYSIYISVIFIISVRNKMMYSSNIKSIL